MARKLRVTISRGGVTSVLNARLKTRLRRRQAAAIRLLLDRYRTQQRGEGEPPWGAFTTKEGADAWRVGTPAGTARQV